MTATDAARLAAVGVIWGLSPLFIKLLVVHVSPLWLVAGRVWSGLAVVLAIMVLRGQSLPREPRTWVHLSVLGTVGTALPWVVLAWAQESMPASLAAVLGAPLPATTLAIAAAAHMDRITWQRGAGMALALFGALAVAGGDLAGGRSLPAIAAAAGCTGLFAFGAVYTKRHLTGMSGVTIAAGQLIPSALVVLPFALLAGPAPVWDRMPAMAWLAWLCLGALATGLASTLFYGLIERVGAATAQLASYLTPVVGVLAAWAVLDEQLAPRMAVGALAIAAGVVLTQRVDPLPVPAALARLAAGGQRSAST